MRAAVVGAGMWGRNIIRTLAAMDSLACIVEADEAARVAISEQYPGVPVYADLAPLLESDVPAACIATPAPTHFQTAEALLEGGKDVCVEKPMTLSVSDAEKLVRMAAERGRVLMVGHLLLYQPAVQWIKQAISSGMVGELKSIHQRRLGLGRARDVENVLWAVGVHDVAVALHLIGYAPDDVQVTGQRVLQPTIEDDIHLQMTFAGGIQNHLHCSWLWPERERGMVVVGSEAMLVYNELEQTVTLHRKSIGGDLKNIDNGSELAYQGSGEPLKLELAHFLECCAERKEPLSSGASGVDVIRVLQNASERLNG